MNEVEMDLTHKTPLFLDDIGMRRRELEAMGHKVSKILITIGQAQALTAEMEFKDNTVKGMSLSDLFNVPVELRA